MGMPPTTSPTKTGEMRQDQYWLLKSKSQWAYFDQTEGCPIEAVIADKCDLDNYMAAPQMKKLAALWGDIIHGRRINDEVELFENAQGKEAPGLRQSLERKGLTVRMYVAQDSTKKSRFPKPNYKAILGKDADSEFTHLDQCVQVVKQSVRDLEKDDDTTIDYALFIDGQDFQKSLVVCVVRAKEFYELSLGELETCSCRGVQYPLLAVLECGELRLICEEKKFISYFTLKRNDEYHLNLKRHDFLEDVLREQRELAKAEKKRAKKHRRQMTQSTVTSPSADSFVSASQSIEDDEAVKERQREKNRVKKKAQKERRRAKQEETKNTENGDTQKKSNRDSANVPTIYGFTGHHLLVGTDDSEDIQGVAPRRQIKQTDLASGNGYHKGESNGTKKRKTTAQSITSNDESDHVDSDEEAQGLNIIQVNDTNEITDLVRNAHATNTSLLVANLEGCDEEEMLEVKNRMKYLGRGL